MNTSISSSSSLFNADPKAALVRTVVLVYKHRGDRQECVTGMYTGSETFGIRPALRTPSPPPTAPDAGFRPDACDGGGLRWVPVFALTPATAADFAGTGCCGDIFLIDEI